MNIINDNRLKLTIPENNIEIGALEQIVDALSYPYLKSLAIMPDVHSGYDLPIGGVALLDGYIWPGAVGYDIGCGMCHINTRRDVSEFPDMVEVYNRIINQVPVGFSVHSVPISIPFKFPNASNYGVVNDAVVHKAAIQLGTLGGGNHFIEIGVNSENEVGITIHSGSRRAGWLIGDFYMRMTEGPVEITSEIGKAYLKDMQWALDFALENRKQMMIKCLISLGISKNEINIYLDSMINENHNHAEITEDGVLHRKGATPAKKGQLGIIPANMRDGVWITEGLGNKEFLESASHGAGRIMSRGKARKVVDFDNFVKDMNGIVVPVLDSLIDEAPAAYKNINDVLDAQDGVLINIIDHFSPILVVKG